MRIPENLADLTALAISAKCSAGNGSAVANVSEANRERLIRTAAGRAGRISGRLAKLTAEQRTEDNVATMLFGPGLILWGWIWANRSAIWFVLRVVARILIEYADTDEGKQSR